MRAPQPSPRLHRRLLLLCALLCTLRCFVLLRLCFVLLHSHLRSAKESRSPPPTTSSLGPTQAAAPATCYRRLSSSRTDRPRRLAHDAATNCCSNLPDLYPHPVHTSCRRPTRAAQTPIPSCVLSSPDHNSTSRKAVIRMDPDCAICHAPAAMACECEAKGLEVAVRQAESRMMQSIYNDIRSWVRAHAQDYILEYFRLLTERRKTAHSQHLERLQAHAFHYYHAPPHPNELAAAQAQLKRGIDEDWQASVQRYPEVLEYFYSLVELTLPDDNEPAVKDPPLSALSGPRKGPRGRIGGGPATTVASGPSLAEREYALPRGRTPPLLDPLRERRTPAPRERRQSYRGPPPPPPSSYYPPPYHQ